MKCYTMYVCETCGFECKDATEMMKHEASHLGLTVDEFEQYNALKGHVRYMASRLYDTNNPDTREQYDTVVEALIAFKKEHNIKE